MDYRRNNHPILNKCVSQFHPKWWEDPKFVLSQFDAIWLILAGIVMNNFGIIPYPRVNNSFIVLGQF